MAKKIIILLTVLVIIPVSLLGYFGFRMANNEQQLLDHRFKQLVDAQLNSVNDDILHVLDKIKLSLLADAKSLGQSNNDLRDYLRRSPYVRQLFMMDPEGRRLHPSSELPMNQREQRFLARTEAIWRDKSILYESNHDNEKQQAQQNDVTLTERKKIPNSIWSTGPDTSVEMAPEPIVEEYVDSDNTMESGWYTWYWGDEMNLILWWRNDLGQLVGFEIEPARLQAEIIAALPNSRIDANMLDTTIRLVDARDRVLYQWGGYQQFEAYQPTENEKPLALLPLSYPLASWKVHYFSHGLSEHSLFNWFNIIATLLVVAIALIGLAIYLYREHMRQHRLAEQRVNFVNQVSHELKTPLTNIRMYAELLQDRISADDQNSDEKSQHFIEVITTESNRLSRLIGNVLNFARAQKQRLNLRLSLGVIDEIIQNALDAFEPALSARNVAINFSANTPHEVQFDHDVLEQILNNLLSNVEKYGASGGIVEVKSWQKAQQIHIRVTDFGPGIPASEKNKIFHDFYRVSSNLSDGVTGTGIGLAIAKQLAQLHGGDLVLLPTNVGACFELTIQTE